MRGKQLKDKRIVPLGPKSFRTEVEFDDGEVVMAGPFKDIELAQEELNRYPRDVALYREVPKSVFIRFPL